MAPDEVVWCQFGSSAAVALWWSFSSARRVNNNALNRFLEAMDGAAEDLLDDADVRYCLRVVLFYRNFRRLRKLMPKKYREMMRPKQAQIVDAPKTADEQARSLRRPS